MYYLEIHVYIYKYMYINIHIYNKIAPTKFWIQKAFSHLSPPWHLFLHCLFTWSCLEPAVIRKRSFSTFKSCFQNIMFEENWWFVASFANHIVLFGTLFEVVVLLVFCKTVCLCVICGVVFKGSVWTTYKQRKKATCNSKPASDN